MGISGTWASKANVQYTGARRWGTGVNPVHGIRSQSGRNIAPDGNEYTVPGTITDPDDDYGYCTEDSSSQLWGYGFDTGTASRPALGEDTERGSIPANWPSPGSYRAGRPGGARLRAIDKGSAATQTTKLQQPDALAGFLNKPLGPDIEQAIVSDPAQYERQTSMTQMAMRREGSQRDGGSASEYEAPVPGTRPTMQQRRYVPSDSYRNAEMYPRQQDLILRPFRYRQAATGNPAAMDPNAMYVSEPMQRVPNPDPYAGESVPAVDIPGFTDEDYFGGIQ